MRHSSLWRRVLFLLPVLCLAAAAAAAAFPWYNAGRIDPLAKIWEWLGYGEFETALGQARRLARLEPDDREIRLVLAMLLEERGDGSLAEAEYARALARPGDRPYLLTCLGRLHLAREEWAAAADDLKKALALSPGLVQAELGYAEALHGLGRRAQAAAALRGVIQHAPAVPEAYLRLGDLLAAGGAEAKELLGLYERGVEHNPSDVDLHLRLAKVLQKLGRSADARAVYALILSLEPANREARKALES